MSTTIFKTVFGSRLYGLHTPESDTDYKEIYIPSFRSILLNGPMQHFNHSTGSNDSKNTKDDVDEEGMSVAQFVRLACKGEMICIDMLHGDPSHWLVTSPAWDTLHANRQLFYTKSMRAYLGYIRRQTTVYSNKGDRLAAIERALMYLEQFDQNMKLSEVITTAPIDDNYLFVKRDKGANNQMMDFYEVCGKRFQATTKLYTVVEPLRTLHDGYGHRATKAMEHSGEDRKAISHAFRAAYQLKMLYQRGEFSYPLPETDFIKGIKLGTIKHDPAKLEEVFEEVNALAASSSFPEKIDQGAIDGLLLDIYDQHFEVEGMYNNPSISLIIMDEERDY